jgi:ParB-like chromosome segregation protein Spo0J
MHNNRNRGRDYEDTIFVDLNDVHMPERTVERIMRKDHAQIRELRAEYESEREMVRVVLRARFGGGYNVEDGRHRVIAAKLAGCSFIEALVVGNG